MKIIFSTFLFLIFYNSFTAQTVLFSENFESPQSFVLPSTGFSVSSIFSHSPSNSMRGKGSSFLTDYTLTSTGNTTLSQGSLNFSFWHNGGFLFRSNQYAQYGCKGRVEYQLNGGDWVDFPVSSYLGTGVYDGGFTKSSYSDWVSGTVYHEEKFELKNVPAGTLVKVRFVLDYSYPTAPAPCNLVSPVCTNCVEPQAPIAPNCTIISIPPFTGVAPVTPLKPTANCGDLSVVPTFSSFVPCSFDFSGLLGASNLDIYGFDAKVTDNIAIVQDALAYFNGCFSDFTQTYQTQVFQKGNDISTLEQAIDNLGTRDGEGEITYTAAELVEKANYESMIQNLRTELISLDSNFAASQSIYTTLISELQAYLNNLDNMRACNRSLIEDYENTLSVYNVEQANYSSALEQYNAQKASIENSNSDCNQQMAVYNQLQSNYNTDLAAYQAAMQAYNQAQYDYDQSQIACKQALETYQATMSVLQRDFSSQNEVGGWWLDDARLELKEDCEFSFSSSSGGCVGSSASISNLVLPLNTDPNSLVWSVNGQPAGTGATPVYNFTNVGSYVLQATLPAHGFCPVTSHQNTVIVSTASAGVINSSAIPNSCSGFNFTLSVPSTGGSWSFGDGNFTNTTGSATATSHNYLSNGSYVVTYTALSGGCPITKLVTVSGVPSTDFSYSIVNECSSSQGVALTINGYAPTLYTYFWEINGVASSASAQSGTYFGFIPGANSVKLRAVSKSNVSCVGLMLKTLSFGGIGSQFTLASSACKGENCPIQGVVSGADSYLWTFSPVLPTTGSSITSSGQYPSFLLASSGDYTVSLTTQKGVQSNGALCPVSTLTKTIHVDVLPDATFTASEHCGLVGVQFTTPLASNLDLKTLNYGDGPQVAVLNHTYSTIGNKVITAHLKKGVCESTYSQTIVVNSLSGVSITGPTVICGTSPIELTAVLSNVPSNAGAGSVTYRWYEESNPTTTLSVGMTYSPSIPGIYHVEVTPKAGETICFTSTSNQAKKTITRIDPPVVSSMEITKRPSCDGLVSGEVVLTLSSYAQGYRINGGSIKYSPTALITGLTAGTNNVTISNAQSNSCSLIYPIEIPYSSVTYTSSLTHPKCNDNDGEITINATGVVSHYRLYNSSHALVDQKNTSSSSVTFDDLVAGTYDLEIEGTDHCITKGSILLSGNVLNVSLLDPKLTVCDKGLVNVDAEAVYSYSQGQSTSGVSLVWKKKDGTVTGTIIGNDNPQTLTEVGLYSVTAIDGTCSQEYDFEIKKAAPIWTNLTTPKAKCYGEKIVITSDVNGGIAPYSYAWSGDGLGSTSTTSTSATIENLISNTTIYLTVTDALGCVSNDASLPVASIASDLTLDYPTVNQAAIQLEGCTFDLQAHGGTAPYYFEWFLQGQKYNKHITLTFTVDGTNGIKEDGSNPAFYIPLTLPTTDTDINSAIAQAADDYQGQLDYKVHHPDYIVEPVQFLIPYTPEIKYRKWLYSKDGNTVVISPALRTDGTPYDVSYDQEQEESLLQYSHSGLQAMTSQFVTGKYTLVMRDQNGCMKEYETIELLAPAPMKPFPGFDFVWIDKLEEPKVDPPVEEDLVSNMAEAVQDLSEATQACMAYLVEKNKSSFAESCFSLGSLKDELSLSYTENVHNYTLYYYDRAGALTKTVSPEGVDILSSDNVEHLKKFRKDGNTAILTNTDKYFPAHNLTTQYRCNGLGQLIRQQTEDGGETRFIYDAKGRLRFSQDPDQALTTPPSYSYTKYDALGRTIESGQSSQVGPIFTLAAVESDITSTSTINAQANDESFPTTLKNQVLYSVYTSPANVTYYGKEQRFLNNRISYIYKDKDGDLATTDDRFTTYYSYDSHGNVEWLVQEAPELGQNYVAYEYDLISGKVLEVRYNENREDKFFHKYHYDAENRLISASTSTDGELWDKDVNYSYYLHGALKRTELGEDHVQGMDNLYTINGWLKSVNTPNLNRSQDPALDGKVVDAAWQTTGTAEDMYGMMLGYFQGDYKTNVASIKGYMDQYASIYTTEATPQATEEKAVGLYNGNISFWADSRLDNMQKTNFVNASTYRYDVLNRIKQSTNFESALVNSVPSPTFERGYTATSQGTILDKSKAFATSYEYDLNGNITYLTRRDELGNMMDDLAYTYATDGGRIIKNQLQSVIDNSDSPEDGKKGDLIGTHNYSDYDERGNLVQELSQELMDLTADNTSNSILHNIETNIEWTVTGKVSRIEKQIKKGTTLVGVEELNFSYDAMDQRIRKEYKHHTGSDNVAITLPYSYTLDEIATTYYVLDASGNQMAMYEKKYSKEANTTPQTYTATISLKEQPIYGSSRIGEYVPTNKVIGTKTGIDPSSVNGPLNFADLKSGLNSISEYQNWITSASSTTTLSGGVDQICQCKVKKLGYDATQDEYIKDPTTEEMTEFLGISENGLAIGENLQGQTQFYAVLAKNYLGTQDACLVYDVEGNLMKGVDLITDVDMDSKPIIIKLPTGNQYGLVTLTTSGKPVYHVIDMDQVGYGNLTPMGEIVAHNKPMVTSASDVKYGWHFTGYEDHISKYSIVYTSRYTPINTKEGKTEIVALKFGDNLDLLPEEHVLYEVVGCGDTKKGELQISPNGDKLVWYQHGKNIAAFDHRQVDIYTFGLNVDKISPSGEQVMVNTGGAGNVGRGMVEMMPDNSTIVYAQNGVYGTETESAASKNVWKMTPSTPAQISAIDPTSPDAIYLYSQIRRGKDGTLYMPNMGSSVTTIHTYKQALATQSNIGFADADYKYNSSIPTQVYKVFGQASLPENYSRVIGDKMYELVDHLGSVNVVITDRKLVFDVNGDGIITAGEDYYTPDVVATCDYYPGGMPMPGRTFNLGSTRHGFQGMEMDSEVSGIGNSYTTEYRQYDPRLLRWKSLDPLMNKFPWMSPFVAFDNNPIYFSDPYGLESGDGSPDDTKRKDGDPPKTLPDDTPCNDGKESPKNGGDDKTPKSSSSSKGSNLNLPNVPKVNYHEGKNGVDEPITFVLNAGVSAINGVINLWNTVGDDGFKGAGQAIAKGVDNTKQQVENFVQDPSKYFNNWDNADYEDLLGNLLSFKGVTRAINLKVPNVGAINKNLATSYLSSTGQLGNFSSVNGFSLNLGQSYLYRYHYSLGAAMNGKWSTPTKFSNSGSAFNSLGLDYYQSSNFAQNVYRGKVFGITVKGIAAPQGMSLGLGTQHLNTGLSKGFGFKQIGW